MTKRDEDFGDWYNETVDKANLCDKRYPIKGMNVWTPYGWKIMTTIDSFIRRELEGTGHGEVNFPLMIPETEFAKEKEHIKGFDAEVYWVTHAGLNPLDVKLVVRPTSETAMYPMFSLWVRSHADLPLKIFQIVNTFRYETKMTRPFMRVREIHFFESHTCHVDKEDAERQITEDCEIMKRIGDDLCLPYTMLVRTDWDKFPGAVYTVGLDTVMPNGKTLQIGSIHYYGTNFSKPYDIEYANEDGSHEFVHQTTYGMSERLLGAVIGVHADDQGLVLPPKIAPVQTIIIPIYKKDNMEVVMKACREACDVLNAAGIRAKVDDRDVRPGSKYFDWEIKGVPLRLEIGQRDLDSGNVTCVRRDNGEKGTIAVEDLADGVKLVLGIEAHAMYEKADAERRRFVVDMDTMEGVDKVEDGKIVRIGWCGCPECGHAFEDRYDLKILGTPYHDDGWRGRCIVCGKDAKHAYAARTL